MPKRKHDTFQRDYLGTMSQLLLVMWAVTSAAPLVDLDFVDQLRNVETRRHVGGKSDGSYLSTCT